MNQSIFSANVWKLRSAIQIYWEITIDLKQMYFHNLVDEWSWVRECLLCNLKEVFRVERKYWFNMILVTEQLWYVWKFHLYSSWKTLKISFSLSFFSICLFEACNTYCNYANLRQGIGDPDLQEDHILSFYFLLRISFSFVCLQFKVHDN